MASRYPETKVVDYCFHPLHVVKDDKDIIVPCGKCDGCLLHKANEWSMRCGMEIDDSVSSIFGTLTYSNKYLPKLYPICGDGGDVVWISDHKENIRFDSVKDVCREDGIIIPYSYSPIPVEHWSNHLKPCINYGSKRDIQLWLKLLRKDLVNYGFTPDKRFGLFRYFILCEVGPTTFRSHFHFLIFCQNREISSYLLECSLYKNWKMCDEDKFTPYCHYCDSGARGYVTQYLTCFSSLPRVYRENKEIRPFRLASKSPGIGFISQDKKKIYEDVARGIIKYTRPLRRLESSNILFYPKDFLSQLFPKCYNFSSLDDSRREYIYGFLFRAVRKCGQSYLLFSRRLSQVMHSQDYLATRACYRFCRDFVGSPEYYYYLLDSYYYRLDMEHLKSFYESQMQCDFRETPEKIFEYYSNIEVLCCSDYVDDVIINSLCYCLEPLGFKVAELIGNKEFFLFVRLKIKDSNSNYYNEVKDIKKNMVKMSKFNEITGNAPTNV